MVGNEVSLPVPLTESEAVSESVGVKVLPVPLIVSNTSVGSSASVNGSENLVEKSGSSPMPKGSVA